MAKLSDPKVAQIGKFRPLNITQNQIVNTAVVAEKLPVGILVCTLADHGVIEVIYTNDFADDIFNEDSIVQRIPCSLQTLWPSEDNSLLQNQIAKVFDTKKQSSFEWRMKSHYSERFFSSQLIPLFDHNDHISQVICTVEDQTAEKMAERNLLHHAFHDSLTGQPNRVLFRNKLEEAVNDCQANDIKHGCAVLIINIDRFQQVNESFGHSAGDRFLIAMATTLRRCINNNDILARLSGDEFAILMPFFMELEEVEEVSARIHSAMRDPYNLDGNEVYTSVSIGIATTLSSEVHPEDLIRDADYAMHQAKESGKSKTEIYHRATHNRTRSQFHLETELRRAVERRELKLYYQPIVDFRSSDIVAFEALTRWQHKDRGFVSPLEFIALAEETNIIVDLGRWALDEACAQIAVWGDDAAPVNVNVSGVQFARDDVASAVEDALKRHGLTGDMLRIELTESAIMANPTVISETLSRLREIGVKIALDDFGTGYSSLNYLHQFPIDVIKIDRSFINQLEWDNDPYKILQMIGMLARNLGHDIVAEGLEDPEHIAMLRGMNFDYGQGYYYSPPLPADKITKMLSQTPDWKQKS